MATIYTLPIYDDEIEEMISSFWEEMRFQGYDLGYVNAKMDRPYRAVNRPKKMTPPRKVKPITLDIGSEMTSQTIHAVGRLPEELLKKLIGAHWVGNELVASNINKSVVKVERASAKSQLDPNLIISVKKISHKPFIHFDKNDPNYTFAWSINSTYDVNTPLTSLMSISEALALYAVCLPNFVKQANNFRSFKTYCENPKNPEAFLNDLAVFNTVTPELVNEVAKSVRFPIDTLNKLEVLEYVLGQNPNHPIPILSLSGFNDAIFNYVPVSTKPQESKMAASLKDRIISIGKEGAARGLIGAANRKAIDTFLTSLGDKCPDSLKTDFAKTLMEGLIPLIIMTAANFDVNDRVPQKIKGPALKAAEFAFAEFSSHATGQVTEQAFDLLLPLLQEYMKGGEMLAELAQDPPAMEDLLQQRVPDKVMLERGL